MATLTNEIGIPNDPEGPLSVSNPGDEAWRKQLHYIFAAHADNVLNVEQSLPHSRASHSVKVTVAQVQNVLR